MLLFKKNHQQSLYQLSTVGTKTVQTTSGQASLMTISAPIEKNNDKCGLFDEKRGYSELTFSWVVRFKVLLVKYGLLPKT